MLAVTLLAAAWLLQLPVPQPFPRPGAATTRPADPAPAQPPTSTAQPAPASVPAQPPASTAAVEAPDLGVPVYPGSQFLSSYDAGRGQRYYLFGCTAPFTDVVTYYRTVLKQRGELVFDAPATHQFDIGRFREDTMAFPPSVTVKEFRSQVSEGYPNPRPDGQPARFPTVIQVVLAPAAP
ncbi:MAG: hypothetical protein AB7Q29_15755 [Vicinamibacterales bacterium]